MSREQARRFEGQDCRQVSLGGLLLSEELKSRRDDPYNLARFVAAQDHVFAQAVMELGNGKKHGHWMWFIFPQIVGLGFSQTARIFEISSRAEAEAYLQHAVLGPRLLECSRMVNLVEGRSAHDIFGDPDELKFHSSMTLFANVATDKRAFEEALERFFGGQPDAPTLRILAALDDGAR